MYPPRRHSGAVPVAQDDNNEITVLEQRVQGLAERVAANEQSIKNLSEGFKAVYALRESVSELVVTVKHLNRAVDQLVDRVQATEQTLNNLVSLEEAVYGSNRRTGLEKRVDDLEDERSRREAGNARTMSIGAGLGGVAGFLSAFGAIHWPWK